jgi:hypothetical protein
MIQVSDTVDGCVDLAVLVENLTPTLVKDKAKILVANFRNRQQEVRSFINDQELCW